MTIARITLTVETDSTPVAGWPGVLGGAAAEGFKVDGWSITETEVEEVEEGLDPVGNFEIGDRVVVTYPASTTRGGPTDTVFFGHRITDGIVVDLDPDEGSIQVVGTYRDGAEARQWVHHSYAELR